MPSPFSRNHFHPQQGHLDHKSTQCYDISSGKENMQNLLQIVEKRQFSLFLISCSQVILNSSCSPGIFSKKLLVYMYLSQLMRTFTKLSKMYCHLVLTFHFPIFRMSECRNPTIKHIFTYTLISPFISTYVIDLFLVILFP